MDQYNTLNVKLPILQLNKLKLGINNGTEITLKISSNVAGDFNDENSFFANGSSANIKLSKAQLHKIGQSGEFLGTLLGPLLNTG